MAVEPGVFQMRVGAARELEERFGDADDELCSVEAGKGQARVTLPLTWFWLMWPVSSSIWELPWMVSMWGRELSMFSR
jgi:hypothetical protein